MFVKFHPQNFLT